MSNIIPQYFIESISTKLIDFNTDSFKCALFTGAYDETTLRNIRTYNQLSAVEVSSGANYPIGGIAILGTSALSNNSNFEVNYYIQDIIISATSGNIANARYAGIYNVPTGIIVSIIDFSRPRNIIEGTTLTIKGVNTKFIKAYQKT